MEYTTEENQNTIEVKSKDGEDELFFAEFEEEQISLKPYYFFCMMYLFNAIFVLPIFISIMLFKLFRDTFVRLRHCEPLLAVQTVIYYAIDIAMAVSVLAMYPLAFYPSPQESPVNYQYWAISTLIFLQSFLLLQSYMMTLNDNIKFETFKHFLKILVSEDNMNQLGLGRLARQLEIMEEDPAEVIRKLKEEFVDEVSKTLGEENIDETLFFFALTSDPALLGVEELIDLTPKKIKNLLERVKKHQLTTRVLSSQNMELTSTERVELDDRNQILKLLRTQGFRGKRHIIDNLLWPQYQYVKTMQHFSDFKMFLIVIFVIMIKLSYPLYAIFIVPDDIGSMRMHIILMSLFCGMYLNMISILVDLIINEDLKGRRYILNVLETLILEPKDPSAPQRSFIDETENELPENEKFKLDLSCNLSLESWDNARRLTITFDRKNQDMYETTFSFLAIYWVYTYIILSQDFLGFDLFPTLHAFFGSSIQEWNMLMDFLLVSMLFLIRVNQGSMYNETFERLVESIKRIATIYEDKKCLFDYYFNGSILYNIENQTYRRMTHSIYCTAAEKTLFNIAIYQNNKLLNPTHFRSSISENAKFRVIQLCTTMEKLVSQIEFDSEHFCHFFLGWFKSDMTKVFSTFLIMSYIFFHRKLKRYLKDQEKEDRTQSS